MQVPFFDLHRMYLEQKAEIDEAVAGALSSGHYILGKLGVKFENEFQAYLASGGRALGCNSGTDALVVSLLASGVGPGDEVITVAHTAIPTITAIQATGARPVFVDLDPATWLLDTGKFSLAVTRKTKALIAVHLYGNMVAVDRIQDELARIGRKDISVIEDVAQGMGAKLHGRPAGTIGRFGAFSFYPTKNIGALGDGGGVYCGATADAEQVFMLRNYGQKERYRADIARGINSRLDEVQAAILSVRLRRLDEWNGRKAKLMARYHEKFAGLPLTFQKITPGCVPGWHLCVVALESRAMRDRFMSQLLEKGVHTIIHYPNPTHRQAAFQTDVSLPVTESLAERIVSLPMNAGVTAAEQEHVIESVKAVLK